MNSVQLKTALIRTLERLGDDALAEQGFRRSPRSTTYSRRHLSARQKFDVDIAFRPTYCKDALAHIYPRVKLEMPEVTAIASNLIDGKPLLLGGAPEILVNRPLEHLVPLDERQQWFLTDVESFGDLCSSIVRQFVKFGIPFFEEYGRPRDIVIGHEKGDLRPRAHESWSIFVIAAYLYEGRISDAATVGEQAFSTPGARSKYAQVLRRLEDICEKERTSVRRIE